MFFYFCIGVLIVLVGQLYHPVCCILGIFYIWFLYSRFGVGRTMLFVVLSILFLNVLQYPKEYKETTIAGTISNTSEKYIIVKSEDAKIKVYGEFEQYHVDDEVILEVTYFDIAKVRNNNAFNYQRYLYGQGIMQQAYCITIVKHIPKTTIFTWLQTRINQSNSVSSYASLFILGIKTQEMEDIYSSLTNLSIVHIFALSGMHIHILRRWLKNSLRFFISHRYLDIVILTIIGIYMYSIPINISFMRAYLVMVIYALGKKYITRLDALAIACLITIFMNPYVLYNISFIFSYVMYVFVIFIGTYKYDTWILYISSIPIILSLQYQLQITSILLSVVFTPMIKWFYMFCLWYLVFGQMIVPILEVGIYIMESMILLGNAIAVYIPFSKPTILFIGMYYYVLSEAIIKINQGRKCRIEICKVCALLLIFFVTSRYSIVGKVVMIDVGQGDCFLIKQPFNQENILIDTGGQKNRDIAKDTIVPYLKSEGIFSLDYVFISHEDVDHSGALESLQEQMPIANLITTYQDPLTIGDIKITMYPIPLETRDRNANSLIFKVNINNISYLFMGDIGEAEEQILFDTYDSIPVDVLKVSHHGSKNSTSYTLLQMTNPKVALISSGKNNVYQHPHDEVVDRLKRYGVHIYRTDMMGMVTIWYIGNDNYIFQ
jgi:competence protein ComEC